MTFPMDYSIGWLAALVLSLLLTGTLAGLMAGLLGVGGGIVIVPVLYNLFSLLGIDESVRMHVAVGTSLATIIPTSIISARSHYRRGSLDLGLLRQLMPGVVLGVLSGAVLSGYLSGSALSA
ncbi:MAG: sulfite exporter TauE/SafE family protein, partial [Gammaproteobacteria bacterium]|nr:sulfite exporter TauE/SafE family protein [Gammaproteobacteria bacterium]